IGFAVSLVGAVGIVLGVVAGVIVTRVGPRTAILGGLGLGAAMSALQIGFPAWPFFLASRLVEGAAHLMLVVAIPTLIAEVSREADCGLTLTLWGTFFGVAFAVLGWVGLPLAETAGPGALMAAHGLYMAVMALALAPFLPGRARALPAAPIEPVAALSAHGRIYSSARIAAPAAGWLFYTFCFVSVLTVLPPFIPNAAQAEVRGAMPLLSILSSMTLGVWLLRYVSAVGVILIGFAVCAAVSFAFLAVPGAPTLALALGAGLGLVQGASFAAVPQLNLSAEARALANGGLAQMGNLGNTLGTPVMVVIIAGGGETALYLTLTLLFLAGAAAHLALARARRMEEV
ncbi:MAG: MFS transporter, partial [Pseudomonadota bacterium]